MSRQCPMSSVPFPAPCLLQLVRSPTIPSVSLEQSPSRAQAPRLSCGAHVCTSRRHPLCSGGELRPQRCLPTVPSAVERDPLSRGKCILYLLGPQGLLCSSVRARHLRRVWGLFSLPHCTCPTRSVLPLALASPPSPKPPFPCSRPWTPAPGSSTAASLLLRTQSSSSCSLPPPLLQVIFLLSECWTLGFLQLPAPTAGLGLGSGEISNKPWCSGASRAASAPS